MCEHLNIDCHHVIVCGGHARRRFCACGRPADFLCDWKVPAKKSGTCDKPVCAAHAQQVAPGKHLCPEHQRRWDHWKRTHAEFDLRGGEQQSLFQEAP
jgi:hypothetical protein